MTSIPHTLGIAACLLWAVACSSDDETSKVPRGPEGFAIANVATVASLDAEPLKNGGTLALCAEPLFVSIAPEVVDGKIGDFLLAPPGGCDSRVDCGWVVLTVFDSADKRVTETASAASPFLVELPENRRTGTFRLHAELRDSNGLSVLTEQDQPLFAEFTVKLVAATDCSGGDGS